MVWVRIVRESAARRELALLRDRLLTGLTAYGPGLQATIDQHAAAVRDILGLTAGSAGPVELAAYARGVQDSAGERGWRIGGAGDDWVTVRLLAAASLASADAHAGLHELPRL
ncbi:DUF6401 family natural product biosynthesis protein [Kribbella sp. HUAS MG21]|uniref:DUF6401 family natural product biosynthesis protein n=1 Tax=Kribbella sp. HUAS MG21 TaxID=3160966 RepID=A0AAU7T9Y7_9ACTN